MATQHFGSVAASTVRGFRSDQFPLMLVVMKTRSAMEVCSVLQGTNSTTIYTCPTVCVFVCLFVCLFVPALQGHKVAKIRQRFY